MRQLTTPSRGLSVLLSLVLSVSVSTGVTLASRAEQGRTLVIDLPTGNVIVELVPQETDFLLQPITGDKVPYYSPENAVRIARALDDAGRFEMISNVLLGTAFSRPDGGRVEAGPQGLVSQDLAESACDLVLDVRGTKFQVVMEDGPAGHLLHPGTGGRFIRFSVRTGASIVDALSGAGLEHDVIARTLVDLKVKLHAKDLQLSSESHNPPQFDPGPGCGECRNYKQLCGDICCGAGGGCTWCGVCP